MSNAQRGRQRGGMNGWIVHEVMSRALEADHRQRSRDHMLSYGLRFTNDITHTFFSFTYSLFRQLSLRYVRHAGENPPWERGRSSVVGRTSYVGQTAYKRELRTARETWNAFKLSTIYVLRIEDWGLMIDDWGALRYVVASFSRAIIKRRSSAESCERFRRSYVNGEYGGYG